MSDQQTVKRFIWHWMWEWTDHCCSRLESELDCLAQYAIILITYIIYHSAIILSTV